MPEDLLSATSILTSLREVMTEDVCKDVEVIGWLYQFYISEKKDDVFAGLKKNLKITPENIPAATQLFTPHWIVRYLVENSLGRLWMLNRPHSKLVEKMEYYIKPEEPETDFIRITTPQELKICDPACGSGHMLTYAFDLLHAIYEEEGFDPKDIPEFILQHNLMGIEIDERAGSLASFALAMKAAEKLGRRRFLRMEVKPDICVLQNISFEPSELQDIESMVGRNLFTADLRATLNQFKNAKNFGSLIIPKLKDPQECLRVLEAQDLGSDMFRAKLRERLLNVLRMAEALSSKYHVVVANPPYMGGKGLNGQLGDFLKNEYKDVKSDVFSAFMVRNTYLAVKGGQLGFMTPFVWMFISSYEKLRIFLLEQKTITSLIQLEYSGFDGATVPICTFTIENKHRPDFRGGYVRLSDFRGAKNQAPKTLEAIQNPNCGWFYRASANDFEKIPGSPIAYWLSDTTLRIFATFDQLKAHAHPRQGMATTNNDLFLRQWFEVDHYKSGFGLSPLDEKKSPLKWFPINKGGEFRRWYGNNFFVVNFENNGRTICDYIDNTPGVKVKSNGRVINRDRYFHEGLTWSTISSSDFSLRYSPQGSLFETKGAMIFFDDPSATKAVLGLLNTKITGHLLKATSPTLDFHEGPIGRLPILISNVTVNEDSEIRAECAVNYTKSDWDAYETSWDFTTLPMLASDYRGSNVAETYAKLRSH